MESVTVTIPGEKLQEALVAAAESVFKSSYDSPIQKAMKAAITEKEGLIKKVVDDIIADALNNTDFKARMGDIVLRSMIESAMKR
jgi:LPS O-antigen subunit length determinant protein (WzzB/FepE family)